jgi:transposase
MARRGAGAALMPKFHRRATYSTRRHWTSADAQSALTALGASGLPLAKFAKREGLVAERLYRWRRQLGAASKATAKPPAFIEVRPRGPEVQRAVVLSLPPSVRLFVATQPVDGRKGADSLMVLVRDVFRHDPLGGHLFIFFSRRRDRARIVYWDRNGLAMWTKRLERGRFSPAFATDGALVAVEAA